jgi:hypothetical protein
MRIIIIIIIVWNNYWGDRGSTVVKVLRYKSEDLCFDPVDINLSDRTMSLESTQPLTEMSTRSISWR